MPKNNLSVSTKSPILHFTSILTSVTNSLDAFQTLQVVLHLMTNAFAASWPGTFFLQIAICLISSFL